MSKLKLFFTTMLFLFSCFGIVSAQDNSVDEIPQENQPKRNRPNLLSELDLTPEQVRQIRRINQSNRQNIRAAQQKVGAARRDLDEAIYAERADEASVQIRLREFQDAQAEIARIRADNEFSIRKVLTPEQLVRFVELRQQYEQFRNNRRQNPNQFRMRNQLRNQRRMNRQKQSQIQ